ncbi:Acb2/Tad1 domain-containing protein, partial [Enterobacter intestinihominis]
PQDGTTVKGYRTLSPGDIERMNRLKGVSRHCSNLLDTEREDVNDELSATGNHSAEANEAARCLAIARTKMQEACMWACRAVARPDADC